MRNRHRSRRRRGSGELSLRGQARALKELLYLYLEKLRRDCWRNRRRVRQRASGRSFAYNLRFPGQIFDGQAGLHQNYFRDYDPETGRYIQSDPIGLGGGINTFVYVNNVPTLEYDVDGHEAYGFLLGPTPRPMQPAGPPRPEVRAWICEVPANSNIEWDVMRAASAAYGVRHANGGKADNAIWREGVNWLTEAAFNRWYDAQNYVINIYVWQFMHVLPTSGESYSQAALDAGLNGHIHADHNSKADMKKWCNACGK